MQAFSLRSSHHDATRDTEMQFVNFLKNISIMGGLFTLAATSPTPVSVDAARLRPHRPSLA